MKLFELSCATMLTEARELNDQDLARIFSRSGVAYGQRTLAQFTPEEWRSIRDETMAAMPAQHRKFILYALYQLAAGNLVLPRLAEDVLRLSDTIGKFQILSKRGGWEGPKNLYDYKDWRDLERKLIDTSATTNREEKSKHSTILLTKTYPKAMAANQAILAELLGLPVEVEEAPDVTYWLRQVNTPVGAEIYGKGTTWCTTNQETAAGYLKHSPLYIIEKQDAKPRRPLLQVGAGQLMGIKDNVVTLGKELRRFVHDICVEVGDKMDRACLQILRKRANVSTGAQPGEDMEIDD